MRQLPKEFWKTPKAAVTCALGNIKPADKVFTSHSAEDFENLVNGENMFARILHIDTNVSIKVVGVNRANSLNF